MTRRPTSLPDRPRRHGARAAALLRRAAAICALCVAATLAPLGAPQTGPALAPVIAGAAQAQTRSLFDPLLIVEGRPVTVFEFDQRRRFLGILGVGGDLSRQAEAALIEERLQLAEADRLEIGLAPQELSDGLAEFAARANLGVEQFVAAIAEAGIEPETFRDFVRAGLVWRKVVRARFSRAAGEITEAEVDRELSTLRQREGVMLSLSEIVLPETEAETLQALAMGLSDDAAFAALARARSIAPSAARGGRLAPIPAAYLGPQVGAMLTAMPAGEISPPLRVPEGVVVYLKHAAAPFAAPTAQITEVDHVVVRAPEAEAAALMQAAQQVRAARIGCAALQASGATLLAPALPGAQVQRGRTVVAALPEATAAAIARLDDGEVGVNAQPGPDRGLVMLCSRRLASGLSTWVAPVGGPAGEAQTSGGGEDAARVRGAIRDAILNRRLVDQAALYLADLRANARIERP